MYLIQAGAKKIDNKWEFQSVQLKCSHTGMYRDRSHGIRTITEGYCGCPFCFRVSFDQKQQCFKVVNTKQHTLTHNHEVSVELIREYRVKEYEKK